MSTLALELFAISRTTQDLKEMTSKRCRQPLLAFVSRFLASKRWWSNGVTSFPRNEREGGGGEGNALVPVCSHSRRRTFWQAADVICRSVAIKCSQPLSDCRRLFVAKESRILLGTDGQLG